MRQPHKRIDSCNLTYRFAAPEEFGIIAHIKAWPGHFFHSHRYHLEFAIRFPHSLCQPASLPNSQIENVLQMTLRLSSAQRKRKERSGCRLIIPKQVAVSSQGGEDGLKNNEQLQPSRYWKPRANQRVVNPEVSVRLHALIIFPQAHMQVINTI